MKNILFSLTLLVSSISCMAQTIDLYGLENYGVVANAYYKDATNFHGQYVGTWLYTNGTTSLKLVFIKKNQITNNFGTSQFYADFLIDEYQYIKDGVEIVNTLNNLNMNYGNNFLDIENYNIVSVGNIWFPSTKPKCSECLPNERRLSMGLNEPSRRNIQGLANSFVLRAFTENGVQKLKVWFVDESMPGIIFDNNGYLTNITGFSIPFGEYILTKQ